MTVDFTESEGVAAILAGAEAVWAWSEAFTHYEVTRSPNAIHITFHDDNGPCACAAAHIYAMSGTSIGLTRDESNTIFAYFKNRNATA